MPHPRPVKKCECLEIRLPYAAKGAFMDKCRQEGRSASESLRNYIEQQIAQTPPARPVRSRRGGLGLLLAGLAAGGLVATALPSLARPSAKASFEVLDTNHDHVLSLAEFNRR
ncbi:MAG: hypothetical protein JWM33_875 [Caulobacteraceae bacterium]|nr:hypothetical protein [Caulobacteraceae bacterium]